MNNDMLDAASLEQPWWRVRPQLVAVLVLLTTVCVAVWADTPARKWMERQVVKSDVPEVQLFAQATRQ